MIHMNMKSIHIHVYTQNRITLFSDVTLYVHVCVNFFNNTVVSSCLFTMKYHELHIYIYKKCIIKYKYIHI